jgi:DNA-binding NtrC family response regulator
MRGRTAAYIRFCFKSWNLIGAMMHVSSNRLPDDVLVVEDDAIIAMDFEDTILGFGVKTVRIAASVTRALAMIDERLPDFALLDIGLVQEKSFAIAERLDALGIPFAFVSGYGAGTAFPAAFSEKPRLSKPCASDALEALLRGAMLGRARR